MDTHQRPVGELTEQEACVRTGEHVSVLYLSMLAECLKRGTLDMQLCVYLCTLQYLCVCEGVPISVSVQNAASSALMAALHG